MKYEYALSDFTHLTEDIVKLCFIPTPASPILSYQSGQYIQVLLDENTLFPLSIANAPIAQDNSHSLVIHLKAGSEHPLAAAFLTQLNKQSVIKFTGPFGRCVAQQADFLYFIAGGTGFSPFQALLSDLLSNTDNPCLLYWGISEVKDLYQKKLVDDWQEKYAHFSYIPVLSNPDNTWQGKTGWVHEVFFKEQMSTLQRHTQNAQSYYVYASGPYPMVQAIKKSFIDENLVLSSLLSDMLP